MNQHDHTNEELKLFKIREKAKLDKQISESLVLHDKFRQSLELIDEVRSNIGTRNERLGALIFGGSRSGKSCLLKHYRNINPPSNNPDGQRVSPVIYVPMHNATTKDEMCELILDELRDPMSGRGYKLDKVKRLANYVERHGVKVVLLDEVQHVIAQGQEKTLLASANFIKGLIDRTKIAFVLAGVAQAGDFFKIDSQVRNRFMTPVELRLELDHGSTLEVDGEKGVLTLIFKLQEQVEFLGRSELYNLPMGVRLCLATEGRVGKILDILQGAGGIAINDGRSSISMMDLAKAYKRMIGDPIPGVGNPFTADIAGVAKALSNREVIASGLVSTNRRIRAKKKLITAADVVTQ